MKKTNKLLLTALLVSGISLAGATSTYAYFGSGLNSKEEAKEFHAQIETAVENNDYDTWKGLMDSKPKITDIITEENFDQLSELHTLKQEGKYEEAKVLAEELGFPAKGKGMNKGFGDKGMHKGEGKGRMKGFVDQGGDGGCECDDKDNVEDID